MQRIEPPRPHGRATVQPEDKAPVPEPPTDRALWPTFMRRTLDEERLRREEPAPGR